MILIIQGKFPIYLTGKKVNGDMIFGTIAKKRKARNLN
jgi:hypothetical protein